MITVRDYFVNNIITINSFWNNAYIEKSCFEDRNKKALPNLGV